MNVIEPGTIIRIMPTKEVKNRPFVVLGMHQYFLTMAPISHKIDDSTEMVLLENFGDDSDSYVLVDKYMTIDFNDYLHNALEEGNYLHTSTLGINTNYPIRILGMVTAYEFKEITSKYIRVVEDEINGMSRINDKLSTVIRWYTNFEMRTPNDVQRLMEAGKSAADVKIIEVPVPVAERKVFKIKRKPRSQQPPLLQLQCSQVPIHTVDTVTVDSVDSYSRINWTPRNSQIWDNVTAEEIISEMFDFENVSDKNEKRSITEIRKELEYLGKPVDEDELRVIISNITNMPRNCNSYRFKLKWQERRILSKANRGRRKTTDSRYLEYNKLLASHADKYGTAICAMIWHMSIGGVAAISKQYTA